MMPPKIKTKNLKKSLTMRLEDAENRAAVAEKKLSFAVAGLQDIAAGNWKYSARRTANITLRNVEFFGGLMGFGASYHPKNKP